MAAWARGMGEEEGEEKREKGVDYDASLLMSAWKIPVDYKVYKGRLGGDLTVNDAYGNLVYRVSGRSFSSSPRSIKTLFDASGTPLISAAFLDVSFFLSFLWMRVFVNWDEIRKETDFHFFVGLNGCLFT